MEFEQVFALRKIVEYSIVNPFHGVLYRKQRKTFALYRRNNAVSIRILIADDHPIVRFALRQVINRQSGMNTVGEASTGQEVRKLALETKPDIILMDICMQGYDGIEATRELSSRLPNTRIIAVSGYSEDKLIREMLDAGASSFLLKNSESGEIVDAINVTMAGECYLSGKIADIVINGYTCPKPAADTLSSDPLSAREKDVLRLVTEGRSSKEIAVELGISTRTVETHRFNIMKKLDIHNISGLVKYVIRQGLTSFKP